jgi:DNA polymerase-3 subunit gamma/tau
MSLYRKYRPQTFEDTVGQEHIAQTLRNALAVSPPRVAHAYLFCGPRGTGKTTSARLLAKCLNCETGPTPTPCNECDFCTRVRDNQTVMDLIEIDAASNTGVDNVRENIIEKVNVAPAQGLYRVYIIDEVHMLSTSSFNALLKTLEEPPAHAIFVLATTDAHKVPATISSRCQRFDFRRVGPADIVRRLQHVAEREGITLEDGAARLIAYTADGALRDALTLLEQVMAFSAESISEADVRLVLGTVSQELLEGLIDSVAGGDAVAALNAIERATEEGTSFSQLTRDLVTYSRDLLLLTVGFESENALNDAERKRRSEQARQIGRARLLAFVEALRAAEKEMRQSTDHRLLLELTLVRAASGELLQAAPAAVPAQARPAAPRMQATPAAAPAPTWRQTPAAQQPAAQPQAAPPTAQRPTAPAPLDTAQADTVPVPESTVPKLTAREFDSNGSAPLETAAANTTTADTTAPEAAVPGAAVPDTGDAQAPNEMIPPTLGGAEQDDGAVASDAATGDVTSDVPPEEAAPSQPVTRKKGRRINDLNEFVELWPAVITRVRKKIGVTAVAYLHDAHPVGLDDKEAILEFKKEFHYEKACEAAKRLPFEQVINECMAMPHRLRFRLAPPPKAQPKAEEAPPPSDDDEDDDDFDRDVHLLAQQLFGAEVVGRSGEG